jgi:hypothetical protein
MLRCCSRDMTALDLRELVDYYHCPAPAGQQVLQEQVWYTQHPQRLLPPSATMRSLLEGVLDWGRYDPADGFVGFGHNLVYLNPQLLSTRVEVLARPGEPGQGCRGAIAMLAGAVCWLAVWMCVGAIVWQVHS